MSDLRGFSIVASCCLFSAVLGSIHAFSVFVPEWEQYSGASRASVSLTYSIALLSLTTLVLLGYRIYRRFTPYSIIAVVGITASLGLYLSAGATTIVRLYLCYGILFGAANGLGYGFTLQLAGQSVRLKRGLAMSMVTAFYAVGATVAPPVFYRLIQSGGNARALTFASIVLLVSAALCAAILWLFKAKYLDESDATAGTSTPISNRVRNLMWLSYGCAVAAGLMVIGHAYNIAIWMGLSPDNATTSMIVIAFGNMLGGFFAGFISGRVTSRTLLFWLPVLTIVSLISMASPYFNAESVIYIGLGVIGFGYGAVIALYPVFVADTVGTFAAARIYGQIFTAWGLAGLLAPWVSAWLFDHSGSYSVAFLLAACLGAVSMVALYFSSTVISRGTTA